ncbi:MAG: hypothetical protein QM705_13080 [Ancrocorticia sp.]
MLDYEGRCDPVSLVFDLVELINIGVGGVVGEGTGSIKDYLVDSVTCSKVSDAFRGVIADSALEPDTKEKLLNLVDEKAIVNLVVAPSGTTLTRTQASWNQILESCDPSVAQKLGADLAEVGTSVILSQQSLPEQILHSRIATLQRTINKATQTAADQALRAELATHIEKLSTVIERLTNESIGRVSAKDSVYEYRKEVLESLTRVDFSGREEELAQIESFARATGNEQWWWWTAGPWAGKTTLMAQIAKDALPSVRVAYLFIIGRQVVHADSDAFYSHLLPQLALLAGLDYYEKPTDLAGKRTQFNRLLRIASYRAQMDNKTILLIIDGLDEDQGTPPEKQSVAYSLPAEVPVNVRILVASRGNPPLPDEVPPGHPLRAIPQHLLTESPAAVAARDRAIAELRVILRISNGQDRYGRDILAFLAASGAALTAQDLSELTGQPRWVIDELLASRDGRSFNVAKLPDGQYAYTLGHDMLDQILVTKFLDTPVKPPSVNQGVTEEQANADRTRYQAERQAALRPWRHRIADWGQEWATKGWPDSTPEYLVSATFVSLLCADPDLQDRGVQIVTDDNRKDLLARKHWADDEALSQLRNASQDLLDHWTNGHLNLLQLAKTLTYSDSLKQKYANVTESLPATLAKLGQLRRAIGIARAIPDPSRRALALSKLTPILDNVADHATSIRTAEEALTTADTITDSFMKAGALARIAQQIARTDPAKASKVTEEALTIANTIVDASMKAGRMVDIVYSLAITDPIRALTVAKTITDNSSKVWALTGIVQSLTTATDPTKANKVIDKALIIAKTITDNYDKARALANIAQSLISIDPAKANKVTDEALTTAKTITNDPWKDRALSGIAQSLSTTGPIRALTVASTITDNHLKAEALASIAQCLAATDPAKANTVAEEALTTAKTITNDYLKASVLAKIAGQLATTDPTKANTVAEEALTTTRTITNGRGKVSVLAIIAQQLATTDPAKAGKVIDEALATSIINNDNDKSMALANISNTLTTRALSLGSTNPTTALEAASTITSNYDKARALTNIAQSLTTTDPTKANTVTDEALTTARTITNKYDKVLALDNIAKQLAITDPTKANTVTDEALTTARTITYDHGKVSVLAIIAQQLATTDPAKAGKVIDEALAIAKTITDDFDKDNALAYIAARLTSNLRDPEIQDIFSQRLGKIWLASGHPWYGWTSLPYLVPDQVQDFIDLATE